MCSARCWLKSFNFRPKGQARSWARRVSWRDTAKDVTRFQAPRCHSFSMSRYSASWTSHLPDSQSFVSVEIGTQSEHSLCIKVIRKGAFQTDWYINFSGTHLCKNANIKKTRGNWNCTFKYWDSIYDLALETSNIRQQVTWATLQNP